MSTSDGATSGGNNARKKAAKDLVRRTGMPYTAALDIVTPPAEEWAPCDRWVLTEDVHGFFTGAGWHGVYYKDLYAWVDSLRPVYECEWCGEDGDARREDSAFDLIVTAYDPDLSPATRWMGTKKNHARCQPSRVLWAYPVPAGGAVHTKRLPATAAPERHGEFQLTGTGIVLDDDGAAEDDGVAPPLLLLTAEVTDTLGEPAAAWHTELEFFARGHGFSEAGGIEPGHEPLVLRVSPGDDASFVALRTEEPSVGQAPHHFYGGALDLPPGWVEGVRERGEALVVLGPLAVNGRVPDVSGAVHDHDELHELLDDGVFLVRSVQVVLYP